MSARAWALALAVALAPAAARADAPPPVPKELPPAPTSPYLLSGARWLELNFWAGALFDSNARTDAPSDARTGRLSGLVGLEIGPPIANQRFRPSLFLGGQFGYFGDDAHGPASGYFGARFRGSFWMGDLWDFYVVGRGDFPVDGAGVAFRSGLGLGARIVRVFSLEVTWDSLLAIGPEFQNTQHGRWVPAAVSVAASFDLCFACNRSTPKQVTRNLACRLYNFAKQASGSTCAVRDAICAAVPKAMTSCPDPLAAARDDDGAATFLRALDDAVAPAGKAAVERLRALHDQLLKQWGQYELSAADAGKDGRKLAERWSYAPVPGELRTYLGCDGAPPPPDCDEVAP
jgi:hypothetical protein